MKKLIEHLMPCAICGAVPKINDIYDIDPEKAEHCYKLFCSENGVHNSNGEWFANKYKACQDWNRRQQALGETIETLGNRLKPCPLCGNKNVKQVTAPLRGTQMFICNVCGADVCFYGAEYEVKARKAWNRRSETEESK